MPIRVLHEPVIGLSRARNVAVSAAAGKYVAFLDDDVVPDSSWLENMLAGLERHRATVTGGAIHLRLEIDPPQWFGHEARQLLAELLYDGVDISSIGQDQYICGGNLLASGAIFRSIGGFSESFGRVGGLLRSSEELEWCRRVQAGGLGVAFVASARVEHVIPSRRLRLSFLTKRGYWQGRSDALLEHRHGRPREWQPRSNAQNLREVIRRLKTLLLSPNKNTRAAECIRLARELGYCLQYASHPNGQVSSTSQSRIAKYPHR